MPPYFHYIWIALAILLGLFIIYRPPNETGVMDFIERHFGDVVGLYVLHLGIILIIIGGFVPHAADAGLTRIGESLLFAGLIALKLKTVPGANGDGAGPSEKVVTQTESTRVTVGSPPVAGHL